MAFAMRPQDLASPVVADQTHPGPHWARCQGTLTPSTRMPVRGLCFTDGTADTTTCHTETNFVVCGFGSPGTRGGRSALAGTAAGCSTQMETENEPRYELKRLLHKELLSERPGSPGTSSASTAAANGRRGRSRQLPADAYRTVYDGKTKGW